MHCGRRSYSSQRVALLVLASVLGIAGCSGGSGLLAGSDGLGELRLATADSQPKVVVTPAKAEGKTAVVEIRPATIIDTDPVEKSAWCRYLREDSAAEATILRSPTLSGNVDDGGKAALSLGLSASSFAKARLIEKAAILKCQRYLAETGLQKLAFISPQGLTAAGFRAKSNRILAQRPALLKMRNQVKAELKNGNLNADLATSLTVAIDQLIADGNAAKSQADRRLIDDYGKPQGAQTLGQDLLRAEADLEDLNNQIRSADAMDVTLSAGWNDSGIGDGFDTPRDSFSGKVSFSVKLGALAPKRFEHERRAKEARLSAIRDQEGGALWQIAVLRKANERALDGLSESRAKLNEALAEVTNLISVLKTVQNSEIQPTILAARIQAVRLEAERAAVDGSIHEINENIKRLKTG